MVYGLLAVCAALVLMGSRGAHEPEVSTLRGKTSKGFWVTLTVVDGEVRSLITTASFYCRHDRTWYALHWTAGKGGTGRFHQDDESFRVSQRYMTMRGHLADDRSSARGTIEGHWDQGEYACSATVRFSARDGES